MSIVDARQRATAIDPLKSFCVTAPAGSGKTELLIQRYLALLSRVERPEQVLAITFTRKAAAEMRERVVQALQSAQQQAPCDSPHQQTTRGLAERALISDTRGNWNLVRDITRINIKTIDSFCGGLTRQMPVLSEFGGQASVVDDAADLYAEAVQALFRQTDSDHPVAADLAVLMLHFDNNWEKLQSLLMAMLARRDQWRDYVGVHHAPRESEAYLLRTIESLVQEELVVLSNLIASQASQLLDLQQYAAKNLGRTLPPDFPGTEAVDVPLWRALRDLLLTKEGSWRKSLTKTIGFPAGKGVAQERKALMLSTIGELSEIEGLQEALVSVGFLPEIAPSSTSWQLVLHLSRVLPLLAAQLLLVFQRHGAVDHSQVALSALQALGEDDAPTELALRLDYQIEHVLVDEFQDTAINQYELLRRLTRGWGQHNAECPQAPRTVMLVGDGMQSIYGFRDANVGLFLKAKEEGFNGVRLEALALHSNFRSDEGIVDWVNQTFTWAFPAQDDISRGQVSFTAAAAVRPEVQRPAVNCHSFHGEAAQQQEVDFICEYIATASAASDSGSMAVLGRSRSHLQPIISGLKARDVDYAAQDMDSLASSPLVADLLSLCCALANRGDRLAWMALLRAPWCGLDLADLLVIGRWGDSPRDTALAQLLCSQQLHDSLSPAGSASLGHILPCLQEALRQRDRLALRVWIEQAWVGLGGPATATEARQLDDAESFFQLLEQADREGIGLDLQWLTRQLQKRYVSAGNPDSKVQLMTLHKAKGLEFDRVIIPQLAKPPRSDGRQLLLWDEHSNARGERGFLLAADDHSEPGAPTLYNYLHRQRQQKSLLETTRLLYVGATRAISQLLLTASLQWDEKKESFRAPSGRSLLGPIWPTFAEQMTVHEPTVAALPLAGAGPMHTLHRLQRSKPPAAQEPPTASLEPNIPIRAENQSERAIGTVVHLALEHLSALDSLPQEAAEDDLQRWQLALQRLGLCGERLQTALAAVQGSVNMCLADEQGRWVLSSAHPQARSEWALTRVSDDGRIEDLIVDRTFLDETTATRWVVDYKNSQPAPGEDLTQFLARESLGYHEQLLRYRNTLADLHTEPLCCALYFTALGHMHHLVELDLAGRGT